VLVQLLQPSSTVITNQNLYTHSCKFVMLPDPLRAAAGPRKPFLRCPTSTSFRRGRDPDAEGVDRYGETGRGVTLTIRLGGLGERRKRRFSPLQRGLGRNPHRKWISYIFEKEATCNTFFSIFERCGRPQNVAGPRKTFLSPSRRA